MAEPSPSEQTGGQPVPHPDREPALGFRLIAASETAIALAWEPVPNGAVTLERDGVPVALPEGTRFVDTEVVAGQTYLYRLSATSTDGSEVPPAETLRRTAAADVPGADLRSPYSPGEVLALSRDDGAVLVAWHPGGDDRGVAGYDLYRDGRYYTTVYSTAYVDDAGDIGPTTFYEVAAFDDARNYSPRSVATFVDGPVPVSDGTVSPVSLTANEAGAFAFAPVNRSAQVIVLVGDDAATALWPAGGEDGARATGFVTSDSELDVLVLPAFGEGTSAALTLQLGSDGAPSNTLVFDPIGAVADDGADVE